METGQGGAGAPTARAEAKAVAPAATGAVAARSRAEVWRDRFRDPKTGRPVWWVEIAILVALYYCYTATRGFAEGSIDQATRTGQRIVRWQEDLHLNIELSLNHWVSHVTAVALVCCFYYATLHFIVTPATILWMHRRRGHRYSRARWTLVFTTLLCLVGFFLFPTAPPRLLPGAGYVDTMAKYADYGWWTATASAAPQGLSKVANLYAAMPSLHCAWAAWVGILLARNARWIWLRVLGVLYPLCTAFVVMATGNHYILDAFAGWAVLGVGALLALLVTRGTARRGAARASDTPAGPGPQPPAGADAQTQEPAPGESSSLPATGGLATIT